MEGVGVPVMYVNVKVRRRGGNKSADPSCCSGSSADISEGLERTLGCVIKAGAVVEAALYSDAAAVSEPPLPRGTPPPPLNRGAALPRRLLICFRSALPGEVLSPELLPVT